MITQILPQILVNDWMYYALIVAFIILVLSQLDALGVTLKREYEDCNAYYIWMGAITFIAKASLVILIINKYIGFEIAPISLVLCFSASQLVAKHYENCRKRVRSDNRGYVEKLVFVMMLLTYLFINKTELNQGNYRIEQQQNNCSK